MNQKGCLLSFYIQCVILKELGCKEISLALFEFGKIFYIRTNTEFRHLLGVNLLITKYFITVPRCRLNTYGRRAFPVAGLKAWNTLPDELRDPACDVDSFKQFFKTVLFSSY